MHAPRCFITSRAWTGITQARTRTWIQHDIRMFASKGPRSAATATVTTTTTTTAQRRSRDNVRLVEERKASDLRREVMDEIMIPGRYKAFFKQDKKINKKMEEPLVKQTKSRSLKKRPAAATVASKGLLHPEDISRTTMDDGFSEKETMASTPLSVRQGRQSVGWRALEEVYAHEVLPHPFFGKAYLDIVQVKLLDDRRTYQFWYRPIPSDSVTSDDIAQAITDNAPAFRAMLARHAHHHAPGAKRLSFQFVRQSDRVASMDDLWRQLEDDVAQRESQEGKIGSKKEQDLAS